MSAEAFLVIGQSPTGRLHFPLHTPSVNLFHTYKRKGESMMSAKEGKGERGDQNPNAEKSPTEKLEGKQPPGSPTPGAQNPESKEIKNEINPNTE
jgi:hypothetical protein